MKIFPTLAEPPRQLASGAPPRSGQPSPQLPPSMPKKKRKKREYPLYTRKARKLTDIQYLVNQIIARTSEARLTLATLPGLAGDKQRQALYHTLYHHAIGNREAERLYQLLNGAKPYEHTYRIKGEQVTYRIPEVAELEAIRKELAAAGIE